MNSADIRRLEEQRKTYTEIDTWFDISRYDVSINFKKTDWYVNLFFRSLARSFLFPEWYPVDPADSPHLKGVAGYIFAEIKDYPVLKPPGQNPTTHQQQALATGAPDAKALTFPSIRPLLYRDLLTNADDRIAFHEMEQTWALLPEVLHSNKVMTPSARAEHLQRLNEPLDHASNRKDGEFRVVVNLQASDARIRADFETWLAAARIHYGHKVAKQQSGSRPPTTRRGSRRVTPHLMEKWAGELILPYLDILLWARLAGHTEDKIDWGKCLYIQPAKNRSAITRPKEFNVRTVADLAVQALVLTRAEN
jgi:hypothetical protein